LSSATVRSPNRQVKSGPISQKLTHSQRSAAASSRHDEAAARAEICFARKNLTDGARLDNQSLGPAVWVGVLGHATPAFPYAHPALFSMIVAFAGIWVFSVTDHSQKAREEARTFTAQYIRSQIGRGAAGAASH
jgi:hypothetical protein